MVAYRKNYGAGTSAYVKEEASTHLPMTKLGGFGATVVAHPDGSKTVTRRQQVVLKAKGKIKKSLAHKASKINKYTVARNVRAHGIGDQFGGPPGELNLTFTSQNANKLDTFVEAKMAARMRAAGKKVPGSKHFMTVVERIGATGGRLSKETILQRQGSATQMRCNVITKHE